MRKRSFVSARRWFLVMYADRFALSVRAESVSIAVATAVSEFPAAANSLVVEELGEVPSARTVVFRKMADVCDVNDKNLSYDPE